MKPEHLLRHVNEPCEVFSQHRTFLRSGVFSASPNPQAGGSPLVGYPRLLIQYIRSFRPYLEAVPENASCRGDRNPVRLICYRKPLVSRFPFRHSS
jgi:hypothetical protein